MQKEETTQRKEVREHIIEGASNLFLEKGIKVVKMDDIAHQLGISKRTVYEHFTDKEELLLESLNHIHRQMRQIGRERIIKSTRNTLEVLLILYYTYFEMLKTTNKNFFLDLKKYPKITEVQQLKEKQNNKKFKEWIQQGIREGLFREDTNSDILIYILKRDIEHITTSNEFDNYSIDELGRSFILFYLRGISTSKGQTIIEDFITKTNKNKI